MSKSKSEAKLEEEISGENSPKNAPIVNSTQEPIAKAALVPTTTELALVAAILRHGRGHDWEHLATVAFEVWYACAREIDRRTNPQRRPVDDLCADLPKPEVFPTSFDAFLKLLLPKKRPAEQEKAYRHFLMDWKNLDVGEAGELLGQHRKEAIERSTYLERAFVFRVWITTDLSCTKRLNGLKGRGKLSLERKNEEQAAALERRKNAVATANTKWRDAYFKSIKVLLI